MVEGLLGFETLCNMLIVAVYYTHINTCYTGLLLSTVPMYIHHVVHYNNKNNNNSEHIISCCYCWLYPYRVNYNLLQGLGNSSTGEHHQPNSCSLLQGLGNSSTGEHHQPNSCSLLQGLGNSSTGEHHQQN